MAPSWPCTQRGVAVLTEAELLRQHRLTLGQHPDLTVWRNQVGVAEYPGGVRVPYGLTRGASDIIGIRSLRITEAHLGATLGLFVAVEVKTPRGRLTTEQERFLALVAKRGGIAVCSRSVSDSLSALGLTIPTA